MEVDSMITPKLQPTKIDVTFSTRIIFGVVNVFNEAKGFVPFPAFALT
jgi:hypothetical protein